MSRNVIILKEDDTIPFALTIMQRCHISGAAVTNVYGDYVGVLSKTDLATSMFIEKMSAAESANDLKVKDFMAKAKPIAVTENATVEAASATMTKHRIHRVFVADENNVIVGVFSSFDVIKLLTPPPEKSTEAKKATIDAAGKSTIDLIQSKHNALISSRAANKNLS